MIIDNFAIYASEIDKKSTDRLIRDDCDDGRQTPSGA
jgi:hypothetical protein